MNAREGKRAAKKRPEVPQYLFRQSTAENGMTIMELEETTTTVWVKKIGDQ